MSRRNNARRRRSYAPRQREVRRRQPASDADPTDFDYWQSHFAEQRSAGEDVQRGVDR